MNGKPRKHQYYFKFQFEGATAEFSLKTPPKVPTITFSTVRRIFTNSIPINLAQQLDEKKTLKKTPNFILVEQLGNFQKKLTLVITFNR